MKLKQGTLEPVVTGEFWYDLFDGGYIKPENFLDENSAKKVYEAIKILQDFQQLLEDNELIEEM